MGSNIDSGSQNGLLQNPREKKHPNSFLVCSTTYDSMLLTTVIGDDIMGPGWTSPPVPLVPSVSCVISVI